MEEKQNNTVLVTLVESAEAKIKVEVRLEKLFESDKMTAKDRMNFLHNVLGWASTKDLADELRLRGYVATDSDKVKEFVEYLGLE